MDVMKEKVLGGGEPVEAVFLRKRGREGERGRVETCVSVHACVRACVLACVCAWKTAPTD